MNKSNKILLGVLSFIVACVVGYALFSETITINGTASAKGSFDITATCEKGFNNDLLTAAFGVTQSDLGEGGYNSSNETCSVSGSTVTINTELQYPSAVRYYTVKMENTGTIDAFVKSAGNAAADDTDLILVSENIKVYNSSTNALVKEINTKGYNRGEEAINYARTVVFLGVVKDSNGTFFDDDTYHGNHMLFLDNTGASYLKIAPGQSFYLVLVAKWPEEATTQGVYSINTSQMIFDFTQDTGNFTESDEAYTCFGGC